MPSSWYRHIDQMRVADISPSGFAPWASVDSTWAPHRQTQQPSIGPMMGWCHVCHHLYQKLKSPASAQWWTDALIYTMGPMLVLHQQLNIPASAQICLVTWADVVNLAHNKPYCFPVSDMILQLSHYTTDWTYCRQSDSHGLTPRSTWKKILWKLMLAVLKVKLKVPNLLN